MGLLATRVKETTTTTGLGPLSLAGVVAGFRTFVAGIGTAKRVYYTLLFGTAWELGIGTVTAGTPDTLSRDILLASSTGAFLDLAAGTKEVFCDAPAEAFAPPPDPQTLKNLSIDATVAASALTIAIKTAAGADASLSDPIEVVFRHSTLTNGTLVRRLIEGGLSMVVPSGATLGTLAGIAARLYVGVQDDAGTLRQCVFNTQGPNQLFPLPSEAALHSATLLDSTSDSAGVLYASAATTSKPVRWLGYIEIEEASAGAWATAATVKQTLGPGVRRSGETVQRVRVQDGATANGATAIPDDNTIPQNTEGTQFMSLAITPTSAINRLVIEHLGTYRAGVVNKLITIALFQDAVANALAAQKGIWDAAADSGGPLALSYEMRAGTTSATTFKLRGGNQDATTLNFNWSAATLGGTLASILQIEELFA